MRYRRTFLIIPIFVCTLSSVVIAEPKTELPRFDYSRIQTTMEQLVHDIGSRPAGSDQASQAMQYVSQELKNMGYYPVYQDYRLPDNRLSRSVDAYYVGTTQREIILTAHVDTVPDSPGANEDASGIAVLLELARAIRNHHIPVGVHFLFLGAEEKINGYEDGEFFSSAQYLDYQSKVGFDTLNGVIILDKAGAGEKFQVLQIDSTKSKIADQLTDLAKRSKLPLEKQVVKRIQESMPFEDAGLATARLEWNPDPNARSPKDTLDKISRKKIESVFTLLENYLLAP